MVSDILELKLLIVVGHHTVLEIELGAFARTTNALNYGITYLVSLELGLTSNSRSFLLFLLCWSLYYQC